MSRNFQEILDKILEENVKKIPKEPSKHSQKEVTAYDQEKQKSELERYKSDTNDRRWLAEWAATIVSFWLLIVVVVLINSQRYSLDSNVLITLLATTTINVLGLMFIVLKGHFK